MDGWLLAWCDDASQGYSRFRVGPAAGTVAVTRVKEKNEILIFAFSLLRIVNKVQ